MRVSTIKKLRCRGVKRSWKSLGLQLQVVGDSGWCVLLNSRLLQSELRSRVAKWQRHYCLRQTKNQNIGSTERGIVQDSARTSTLGVTTPLRNLLDNHKELEGWVCRGVGRLNNDGLDSDLERSEFSLFPRRRSQQTLLHTCVSAFASGTTQPSCEFALYILHGILAALLLLSYKRLTSRCACPDGILVQFSIRSPLVPRARQRRVDDRCRPYGHLQPTRCSARYGAF